MKKCSLDELLKSHRQETYENQYNHVKKLIEKGEIKPIASSGTNGKKPALPLKFWLVEEQDFSDLKQELLYNTSPKISLDYYIKNLSVYAKEREAVQKLGEYLDIASKDNRIISINERSYDIWKQEKFLTEKNGRTILKHCGIGEESLNYYVTSEPFAYYANHRHVPQTVLVVENKDTFYSMRRHLLAGNALIFGESIGTLIYGAGKRVCSTFKDFRLSAEPYLLDKKNNFVYFGDLDYEGIIIYEKLADIFQVYGKIKPFVPAYEAMICKEDAIRQLPYSKEGQNKHIYGDFFEHFSKDIVPRMKAILQEGRYIPQECLNITDF